MAAQTCGVGRVLWQTRLCACVVVTMLPWATTANGKRITAQAGLRPPEPEWGRHPGAKTISIHQLPREGPSLLVRRPPAREQFVGPKYGLSPVTCSFYPQHWLSELFISKHVTLNHLVSPAFSCPDVLPLVIMWQIAFSRFIHTVS